MVDDALSGNRLIGMIQPVESEDDVLKPHLSASGLRRTHRFLPRDRG